MEGTEKSHKKEEALIVEEIIMPKEGEMEMVDETLLDKTYTKAKLLDYMLRTLVYGKWMAALEYTIGKEMYKITGQATAEEMVARHDERLTFTLMDCFSKLMEKEGTMYSEMERCMKVIERLKQEGVDRSMREVVELADDWVDYYNHGLLAAARTVKKTVTDSVQGVFPGQGAENGDDDAQSTVNSLAATLYPAYIKHYLDQSAEHVEGEVNATDHGHFRSVSLPLIKMLGDGIKSLVRLIPTYLIQHAVLGQPKEKKKNKQSKKKKKKKKKGKGKGGRRRGGGGNAPPYLVFYKGERFTMKKWQKEWRFRHRELVRTLEGAERMLVELGCCESGVEFKMMGGVDMVDEDDEEEEKDVCAICLEVMMVGEEEEGRKKWFVCDHVFHDGCVEGWRAFRGEEGADCPICRRRARGGGGDDDVEQEQNSDDDDEEEG